MSTDLIVAILVGSVVPAAHLYPLVYLFRPWHTTPQGRALFIKALGNVVIIDMSFAYAWFGDYPGRDVVRILAWSLLSLGINYLFWSLVTSPGAKDYWPFRWRRRR